MKPTDIRAKTDDELKSELEQLAKRSGVELYPFRAFKSVPELYSTMLLWLLSEFYERLPEVGDPEKPKLVFFFDEAHLLFNDAPKPLMDKI